MVWQHRKPTSLTSPNSTHLATMTSNRLNTARSGQTPTTDSASNSRGVDLSRYTSPSLNFDQVIPNIGHKLVYTGFQLELSSEFALRPLLNAGIHSLTQVFGDGKDMQLLMLPPHDGVTAYAVLKNGHPLSQVYACPMKEHVKSAWAMVLQDQRLRQNFTYPVAYPQEALDFCRMTPQLIAPSGPFLTHHVLPGHFVYPDLFSELIQFETHLFCLISLSKDSHALDRN